MLNNLKINGITEPKKTNLKSKTKKKQYINTKIKEIVDICAYTGILWNFNMELILSLISFSFVP